MAHQIGWIRWITGLVSIMAIAAIEIPAAQALPGQSSDEVMQWIKFNQGLNPSPGERLIVRRNNGPAQRLIFEASPLAPGRLIPGQNTLQRNGKIRTETLTLFDILYGVTEARLEESLRTIYGTPVYRDFQTAQIIYAYPSEEAVRQALKANQPMAAALKGELRQGRNFAYWIEVARNKDGLNYSGKVMVFLPEDLPKLEGEIKGR
jgi:hypothetical protein